MKRLLIAASETFTGNALELAAFAHSYAESAGGYSEVIIPLNASAFVIKCAQTLRDTHSKPYRRPVSIRGRDTAQKRRERIVSCSDVAVIFWDGKSAGTRRLIDMVERKNIPFALYITAK